LRPAADVAEEGFAVSEGYAKRLKGEVKDIARFEGTRAVLLKGDGRPYAKGEVLRQADLARTYRGIAEGGTDYFYKGAFARAVGEWMGKNGGVMTAEDFAKYEMKVREPVVTTYRGYTVVGFPPPSSGGVHVAEMLNILEGFDLRGMGEADRVHVVAEAMKLAFADRAHWLGDPDHVKVPRGLVDKGYAKGLAAKISMERTGKVEHGTPPAAGEDVFGRKHTTHIATADAEGNFVALTATVNTTFGSKVIVPGTGVILNNQMDDFSIQPGVANHFGLVGADANAVGPGKRPLSSMSPTVILKDGRPVLTVGAAGGPKIITQVLLATINVLDLGDDAREALVRPRFHHQWSPDEVWIERTSDAGLRKELTKRGHKLNVADPAGASQLIVVDQRDGSFHGAAEPRGSGKAAGF
jgi:gamma-glutamyltranspeptidase/glutathione hydrolase